MGEMKDKLPDDFWNKAICEDAHKGDFSYISLLGEASLFGATIPPYIHTSAALTNPCQSTLTNPCQNPDKPLTKKRHNIGASKNVTHLSPICHPFVTHPVRGLSPHKTTTQKKILGCLGEHGGSGCFKVNDIAAETSLSTRTVRRVINALRDRGDITTRYDPINKCLKYFIHHSTSSTPKKCEKSNGDYTFKSHPELKFWREIGLNERKLNEWIKEFELSEEDLINSLCYAAYDLVENDKLKTVSKPMGWFYRSLKHAGHYRRPENYQSYVSAMIDRTKAKSEELKRELNELKKVRQDNVKLEHEIKFEKILSNPESKEYLECLANISSYIHESKRDISNIIFLSAMRESYKKLNNLEGFDGRDNYTDK